MARKKVVIKETTVESEPEETESVSKDSLESKIDTNETPADTSKTVSEPVPIPIPAAVTEAKVEPKVQQKKPRKTYTRKAPAQKKERKPLVSKPKEDMSNNDWYKEYKQLKLQQQNAKFENLKLHMQRLENLIVSKVHEPERLPSKDIKRSTYHEEPFNDFEVPTYTHEKPTPRSDVDMVKMIFG